MNLLRMGLLLVINIVNLKLFIHVKSSSFYFLYLLEFFSAINLYVLLYTLLLLFSYSYSMTWNTHNAMIESQIFILYTSEPIKRTVANFKVVLFSYKENVSIHENVHV